MEQCEYIGRLPANSNRGMAILAIPDQVICLAWRQKLLRNVAGNVADSYAFGALYRRSVDAEHPDDATEHINALEAFVGNLAEWLKAFASRMQLATEEP